MSKELSVCERCAENTTSSRALAKHYRSIVHEYDEGEVEDDSLAILHYRGSQEEFDIALEYCHSEDPDDRAVGAHILGQLGWKRDCFRAESIRVLISLLSDNDLFVVGSAAVSLGHRRSYEAIEKLITLKKHSDASVRFNVVFGLSRLEDLRAINALIELSQDQDLKVRNWATFGLGTQIDSNTNEICNALRDVLESNHDDDCAIIDELRGEALLGLAKREVGDICTLLLREWRRPYKNILTIEAAELVAAPVLLQSLLEFKETFNLSEDKNYERQLDAAIAACSPSNQTS